MQTSASGSRQAALDRHRAAVRARLLGTECVRAGPGSISWKINGEMIVVAGWGRAILLQLAHPSVAAGVHHHSSFRGSLLSSFRRFHSTVGSMLALTFGDTEQMIDRRGPHQRDPRPRARTRSAKIRPKPTPLTIPILQRWVHATLLDSIPLVLRTARRTADADERDRYCDEAAIMEPLLGMPAGWLPRDASRLDAYMREMLSGGRLAVTDTSRALARAVLFPPRWQAMWPVFRPLQLLTIGSLPPSIREAYGFEWRPRDERAWRAGRPSSGHRSASCRGSRASGRSPGTTGLSNFPLRLHHPPRLVIHDRGVAARG